MSYIVHEIRGDAAGRYTILRELADLYDLTVFSLKRDPADDELKIVAHGFTTSNGATTPDNEPHFVHLAGNMITTKELYDYIVNIAPANGHDLIGLPRLLGHRFAELDSSNTLFGTLDYPVAFSEVFPQGLTRTAYLPKLTDIFTELRAPEDEYEPRYVRYITPTMQRWEEVRCEMS